MPRRTRDDSSIILSKRAYGGEEAAEKNARPTDPQQ